MDSPPQFAFNPRVARNENDRRPSESYHPHHHPSVVNSPPLYKGQMPEQSQSYQPPWPPQNIRQPPEQGDLLNRFRKRHRSTSNSSLPQHEMAPKPRTTLHFDYQRYSSPPPPPTDAGIPPRYPNPPSFPPPPPSSAQQPMRVQTHSHHQRTTSSPLQHSSSPILARTVHRPNEPSPSSAGSSPLDALPSRGPHRPPPIHRGVDQPPPNHQHVNIVSPPAVQMRPQLQRETQEPIRRHTVDSAQVISQQMGSSTGGRPRTASSSLPSLSYPAQPRSPLLRLEMQQQVPPHSGQANVTPKTYPIPPPFPPPRRPASAVSPTSPPPPPSMSQPPQPPHPPHPPHPQQPPHPPHPQQPPHPQHPSHPQHPQQPPHPQHPSHPPHPQQSPHPQQLPHPQHPQQQLPHPQHPQQQLPHPQHSQQQPPHPPQQPQQPQPQQSPQLSPQSPSQLPTTDETSSIPDINLTESVDSALEPLRSGFENVLTQTVQNVHSVMSRMQRDFTRLLSAERRKNSYLMRCLVNSSEKLKGQEWAVDELKKENNGFKEKAVENGRLKMENTQKLTVIDSLNQENNFLRRENNELRKKNEEVKEALSRAAGFVFQYKEELDKVRADIDTLRKSRDASTLSPQTTAASSDHQREMSRLHAERERERIFNDAVKQLRALTALEDSQHSNPDPTRRRDSEEAVVIEPIRILSSDGGAVRDRERRTQSSLLEEVSISKQKSPSIVGEVHDTEYPGPSSSSTFPPTTKVAFNKEGGSKVEEEADADEPDSREIVDVDMNDGDDEDNVTVVVPPITSKRVTTTPPNPALSSEPDAEEHLENEIIEPKMQQPVTDESREESRPQHLDMEKQRQKRRQARRGPSSPSPVSSPQTRSRKNWPLSSKTGMKRNRDEYEEEPQEADTAMEEVVEEEEEERMREDDPTQIVHSPSSLEREVVHGDTENSEEAGDDITTPDGEQQHQQQNVRNVGNKLSKKKDKARLKDGNISSSTEERHVPPPPQPQSKKLSVKDVHPKALGRWKYYTHFKDSNNSAGTGGVVTPPPPPPPAAVSQPSTSVSPPSQNQRPPKRRSGLGINHMDLLYKTEKEVMACRICLSLEQNLDSTAAERRKARANTKKFPLNASWADLINHCQTEHTKACEDMEKLSPSQIAEMKQRMSPGTTTTSTR